MALLTRTYTCELRFHILRATRAVDSPPEEGALRLRPGETHSRTHSHQNVDSGLLPQIHALVQQFSTRGDSVPQGTFGKVWRHFWLSQLRRGSYYWHPVDGGQGCCWTSCNAQLSPSQQRMTSPQMSIVDAEKPRSSVSQSGPHCGPFREEGWRIIKFRTPMLSPDQLCQHAGVGPLSWLFFKACQAVSVLSQTALNSSYWWLLIHRWGPGRTESAWFIQ